MIKSKTNRFYYHIGKTRARAPRRVAQRRFVALIKKNRTNVFFYMILSQILSQISPLVIIFLSAGIGAVIRHIWPENKEKIMEVKETPAETIKRVCIDHGLDPALALRVAKCESGLNPNAKNVNMDGSIDRGLFQINSKYHSEVSPDEAFDAEFSANFFCKQFKIGMLSDWNASKTCWIA